MARARIDFDVCAMCPGTVSLMGRSGLARAGTRTGQPLRTLDLDSLWEACLRWLGSAVQYHSCSLLFRMVNGEPQAAFHDVAPSEKPKYRPVTSLTVSRPWLAAHPQIKSYRYSEILAEDPGAARRRWEQEAFAGDWGEFVHLAFWDEGELSAVFSVRRAAAHAEFTESELAFLHGLYPLIDAGLFRVREAEAQRLRICSYESFLTQLACPVILVSFQGDELFASPEFNRIAAQWNQALPGCARRPLPRLPRDLPLLIGKPSAFGLVGWNRQTAMVIDHSSVAGLRLQIVPLERTAGGGEGLQAGFALSFVEVGDVPERSEAPPLRLDLLERLSKAERRVALLAGEGLRNVEIARRLSRSRRTVEFQLHAIYRKLGLESRAQLVRVLR